jgi:hypothetical protein
MKMSVPSKGLNVVKYIAFTSIAISLVITYNYISLSHKNSSLKITYDERIKEFEQQAYTNSLEFNRLKRLEDMKQKQQEDLKIFALKLEDSTKNVESLRERLVNNVLGNFYI